VAEEGSDDPAAVNRTILRQSRNAPEGIITIDNETRHGWRPFFLGKVRPDGQFEIVWSLTKSIRPTPFPVFRPRPEWESLRDEIARGEPHE
jgi:urea transport system substrate-binding protein